MRNIAFRLAYDGTDFVGSQWQSSGRSVQGVVEDAWLRLTQERCRFLFSGRTDAGVHAQGQVANVRTETHHSIDVLQRALNALLPADVSVLDVWEAALDFHARYDAIWRFYRYIIDHSRWCLPQLRRSVWHVPGTFDVDAMQAALKLLVGKHDFAAFARVAEGHSSVRVCYHASCECVVWSGRSLLAFDLVANGFLHHMVRVVVGTLLRVGRGQLTPESFGQILEERNRQRAGPIAAAHGLTLMAVGYPKDR